MRFLPHLTKLTAPARRHHHITDNGPGPNATGHICPRVRLALYDGTERDYLLDVPSTCPHPQGPHARYEPRVHLAYVLARQGHGAHWLARFTDLPLPAAERITEAITLAVHA
ncbi:hypothetical protein MOV08_32960 [Streptomyces yunnanensis]|uniref:Uncharacterized protein n=1 Tax=Streptomyces yunnanensis TaxID=156453 RepID=A0ABY8AJ13_9ACTN|nr:hypothetical protein [Streptomyces yunnanensis]WEB43616.1 hypothetical protein MOV08_32960 [Streptomyces yunnanensis]